MVKLLGPKQIETCEGHTDMGCFFGKPSVSLQFLSYGMFVCERKGHC